MYVLLRDLNCLSEAEVEFIDLETFFQKLRNDIGIHLKLASSQYEHLPCAITSLCEPLLSLQICYVKCYKIPFEFHTTVVSGAFMSLKRQNSIEILVL